MGMDAGWHTRRDTDNQRQMAWGSGGLSTIPQGWGNAEEVRTEGKGAVNTHTHTHTYKHTHKDTHMCVCVHTGGVQG